MGHGGAALHQELQHAATAELVEHRPEVAPELEGGQHGGAGRGPPEHHPQRLVVGAPEPGRPVGEPHGQGRVVGPDRACPDQHGVGLGPQPVGVARAASPVIHRLSRRARRSGRRGWRPA